MKVDEIDRFEIAVICLEAVLFVPTVFGNVLILISIGRFRRLQTPLNGLVGNLAVSDLVTVLILTPGHIVGAFLELNRVRAFCLFYLSSNAAFLLVSLLTMLAISMERYYSVARSRLPNCCDDLDRKNVRKHMVKMYLLMAMSAAFLICWGPFCVMSLYQLIFVAEDLKWDSGMGS
ncbi:alpha-2A adrenergic receptor-like [Dreissena polymorpha]|uniref:alpha-2A adrenergic receptor-like n=1 Tax=Dreissena polymorpha TaxID=45954 RepID=UPI00226415E4|nr:alpha-2A adrenergic receptor-like [Dreissena polymorpha]